MTEDQAWQKAMEDLKAYEKEQDENNAEIMNRVVEVTGNKALSDFEILLEYATVMGKFEIVRQPGGENKHEICGVFTEVWVDQWSIGTEGGSFEGFIYGRFSDNEWIKIPYEY